MDMESQVARRRVNMIASHFALIDDVSASHVLPVNCSSSLNSVIQRRDNRMHFARQGSASQAYFMKQATTEENCGSSLNTVFQRRDNKLHFARQGSASQAYFMRQAAPEEVGSAQYGVPLKGSGSGFEGSDSASEAPIFSRPVRKETNLANPGVVQPVVQGFKLTLPEPPKFAKPGRRTSGRKQLSSKKKIYSSDSNGIEWSPRMDVAESGRKYVMTVEIPGVNINEVRVEVNDQKLSVMGRRSTQYWKVAGHSYDSISAYHKREILQGPYQVVWPLPANVNKDGVSAEFLDGLLQIIIPKL